MTTDVDPPAAPPASSRLDSRAAGRRGDRVARRGDGPRRRRPRRGPRGSAVVAVPRGGQPVHPAHPGTAQGVRHQHLRGARQAGPAGEHGRGDHRGRRPGRAALPPHRRPGHHPRRRPGSRRRHLRRRLTDLHPRLPRSPAHRAAGRCGHVRRTAPARPARHSSVGTPTRGGGPGRGYRRPQPAATSGAGSGRGARRRGRCRSAGPGVRSDRRRRGLPECRRRAALTRRSTRGAATGRRLRHLGHPDLDHPERPSSTGSTPRCRSHRSPPRTSACASTAWSTARSP